MTSLIGPSGCGKSTLLRTVNRIIERLGYVRTTGAVEVLGHDVFGPEVALSRLRRQIGMVLQRPNPLPLSVRDNVLFALRLHDPEAARSESARDEALERSLRQVLLWDAVKDRLDARAIELSLEEQQKLCIARLLPVKPAILLMDEPCSALDPRRHRGDRGADLGAARRLHHPDRDAQHGPGAPRLRRVRLHAARARGRAPAHRRPVRHARATARPRTTSKGATGNHGYSFAEATFPALHVRARVGAGKSILISIGGLLVVGWGNGMSAVEIAVKRRSRRLPIPGVRVDVDARR